MAVGGKNALQHWVVLLNPCATFLLDVLGGAGAVWGCAEAADIRGGPNNDQWRIVCALVGVFCMARWFGLLLPKKLSVLHAFDGPCATFLLQVCGAAGAVWGMAEIVGFRVNYPENCHEIQDGSTGQFQGAGSSWAPSFATCENTYWLWRIVCGVVFAVFLVRWHDPENHLRVPTLLQLHAATFVLEVCGGAGALWGASEIAGPGGHSLRTGWGDEHFGQESFDFWRWCCLPVFVLCFVRWCALWTAREESAQRSREESQKETTMKPGRPQLRETSVQLKTVVPDNESDTTEASSGQGQRIGAPEDVENFSGGTSQP